MSDAAVLWLDDGQAREDAVRALSEWARARGVTLQSLEDGTRSATKTDLTIADRVEKELDRAREAIGSNDADTAERALARAETTLREHPELPQAAWLRAEAERTWSVRFTRLEPRDEARARMAWENAEALDGGRAPGIGEPSFSSAAKPAAKVRVSFILGTTSSGPPAARARDAIVRLDGRVLPSQDGGMTFDVDVAPAEHQVLVTTSDGGRVLFAAWIAPTTAGSKVRLGLSDGGACTREALAGAHRDPSDPTRVSVPAGVTCPSYLVAAPGEKKGSIFVARCDGESCGPLLEWRVERFGGAGGPPQTPSKSSWPAWATWTLLGIGAATATSVALVATGVFDQRPVEPRFVVGGARQE